MRGVWGGGVNVHNLLLAEQLLKKTTTKKQRAADKQRLRKMDSTTLEPIRSKPENTSSFKEEHLILKNI